MNKLKQEFDKLSDDQYNVIWDDKVEIIYLRDYIDFLEKKIEALSQHDVSGQNKMLKAFVDEFIEAWEDGDGIDSYFYKKAKNFN